MLSPALRRLPLVATLTVAAAVAALSLGARASGAEDPPVASAFAFSQYAAPVACTAPATAGASYFTRAGCGFGEVTLEGPAATADVQAVLRDAGGEERTVAAATRPDSVWRFAVAPGDDWAAGPVEVTILVAGRPADGTGEFFLNTLGADLAADEQDGGHQPGDPILVSGTVFEQRGTGTHSGTDATFRLRAVDADGDVTGLSSDEGEWAAPDGRQRAA